MITRFMRKLNLILRRRRAKRFVAQRLNPAIDWPAMNQLKERFADAAKYPDYHTPSGAFKFFDFDQYLVRNAERVLRLGLDESPPRNVLDLGCGFGYFLACCKVCGHKATGLDLSVEIYDSVCAALKVAKIVQRIEPFQPLPTIPGGPFDVVTAYEINFDIVRTPAGITGWTPAQWDFFLRDLSKQMTDAGRLTLKFNDKQGVRVLQGPVLEYFQKLGAEIDNRLAHLPGLKGKLARMPGLA